MKQQVHRIRDRSLEKALQKVKRRFGPDAMIQETREVNVRKENSLGIEKMYEISVLDGEGAQQELTSGPQPSFQVQFPEGIRGDEVGLVSKLRKQISRLESLNSSCREIHSRLKRTISGRADYPLYDQLIEKGVFVNVVNAIMESYFNRAGRNGEVSGRSALEHIRRNLKTVDTDSWEEISGTHIFVGAAGSGKTTVVCKLAGRLSERGRKVKVISLFPRNLRDLGGFEIFNDSSGVEVVVAKDLSELDSLLSGWRSDTVLIDSPCVLSDERMASRRFAEFVRDIEGAYLNYVFEASAGIMRLRRELAVFDWLCGDFAVLNKYDLVEGKGAFLNLIPEKQLVFSFINDSSEFETGLEIISDDLLLSFIRVRREVSEPDPGGSFLLNYGAGPDDTDSKRRLPGHIGAVYSNGIMEKEEVK